MRHRSTHSATLGGLALPIFVSLLGLTVAGVSSTEAGEELRLNQIQVVGSHNSYKEAISPSLKELYSRNRAATIEGLDYEHVSLTDQLEHGLRKLEIDIFYDPEGGRYADPAGPRWVEDAGLPPGPPFDPDGEMAAPGFKVLHVQDLDFRSNCLTLRACFEELLDWSKSNPRHLPVTMTFNAKDAKIDRDGFVEPLPFDSRAYDALDAEILDTVGRERLITPDDVRGTFDTLEDAVLAGNWQTLDDARGKFLLALDERGEKREAYVEGHPSLRGRVLFVNAEPGTPEAALCIVNNPVRQGERIGELVRAGYLVRTRADANTTEARTDETARREAAFRSGAHFVSTDYYAPDERFGTGYSVTLPGGGVARCNPVNAPRGCMAPAEP